MEKKIQGWTKSHFWPKNTKFFQKLIFFSEKFIRQGAAAPSASPWVRPWIGPAYNTKLGEQLNVIRLSPLLNPTLSRTPSIWVSPCRRLETGFLRIGNLWFIKSRRSWITFLCILYREIWRCTWPYAFTMIMEHAPGILLSFGGEVINLSRYNLRSLFDSRIPQPTNSHKLLIRGSSHMFEDAEVTIKKKKVLRNALNVAEWEQVFSTILDSNFQIRFLTKYVF